MHRFAAAGAVPPDAVRLMRGEPRGRERSRNVRGMPLARDRPGGSRMPRASASMIIHAPPSRLMRLYRDYTQWARLFPATIRGVRLIRSDGVRTEVEVDHREGLVPNVMTEVAPNQIDLWESKRRYDATFKNRFDPVPEGTRYTISADVHLKGAARLLAPVAGPIIRRRMVEYVLAPMRRMAERGD
jgi:hypothetical protein